MFYSIDDVDERSKNRSKEALGKKDILITKLCDSCIIINYNIKI